MLEKLKINKKLLRQLDFQIIIVAVCIVIFGAFNIYSAKRFDGLGFIYMKLQLTWLIVGLAAVYVILLFDYIFIANYVNLLYWGSIILLILNDFVIGNTAKGATAWIKLGNRAIQPSEFAKIAMILMLAKKIEDMEGEINKPKNFFILLFYALVPMLLIVIQPDMGMTMVCFFIVLGIFFIAGLDLRVIFGGLASVVTLVVIVWNSPFMKTYWKMRLTTFLHPEEYKLGYGLQLIQSMMGIGSGRIIGTGFAKGTQVKFVPEAFTDFIFAVVGEEWGILGALFLLFLYGILIYKFIRIAKSSKDIFGSIICVGVTSTFLFSILQNIGMTIGIMPITGITLPLMSYGGSSLLTTFMSIGLVLNVGMRRKKINF